MRAKIDAFCGACHAVPRPETFPRHLWRAEVEQGFAFYQASGRADLEVPPVKEVVAYYQVLAPEKLQFPQEPLNVPSSRLQFRCEAVPFPFVRGLAAVSAVRWRPSEEHRPGILFVCDMLGGDVYAVAAKAGRLIANPCGKVRNPAYAGPCDLDCNGYVDLLVAALGSFLPEDHDRGRVVWLRDVTRDSASPPVVLLQGVGRVCDVQPGDFDGDGDTDLIVAEFGWRTTGRILLLECVDFRDGVPEFRQRVLDQRHGAIHLPVVDFNGDGHLDFFALVSQEHEKVELFLNRGDGTFTTETVFAAGDPAYGSSGIQLVDLDGDGDLDVLYTNGDSLDALHIKPYHAVHWLENQGKFPFGDHVLTHMPGVYRSVAGDLDSDGDMDVVAAAFIPPQVKAENDSSFPLDCLIWLEQVAPGEFVRHPLDCGGGHVAVDVGDLDADGDLDLAVGSFSRDTDGNWLTIWWNETPRSADAGPAVTHPDAKRE